MRPPLSYWHYNVKQPGLKRTNQDEASRRVFRQGADKVAIRVPASITGLRQLGSLARRRARDHPLPKLPTNPAFAPLPPAKIGHARPPRSGDDDGEG